MSDEDGVRFFDEVWVRRQNALVLGRTAPATEPEWRLARRLPISGTVTSIPSEGIASSP